MNACANCKLQTAPAALFCPQCGTAIARSRNQARPAQLVAPPAPKKKGGGVFWIILCTIAVIGGISAQGGGNAASPRPAQASTLNSEQIATVNKEQGIALPVQSDPKAKYQVLAVERGARGLIYVQSRREGPSGVSFSERQVNCGANTFAYTREGDTLNGLLAEPRKPDPMGPRVTGSISDVVSQYACDHPPEGRKVNEKKEADLATSAGTTPTREKQPAQAASAHKDDLWVAVTQDAVRRSVRDPSSATFRNVKLYRPFPSQDTPVVCGEVNSKNGFGGMSGFQGFIGSGSGETFPVVLEEHMAEGEYANSIRQLCINSMG